MSQNRQEQSEQIAAEHEQIRRLLSTLETTESVSSVRQQVASLLPILRDHFAVEEDLAAYEAESPGSNLAGLVKVLQEHPKILAEAETLLALCQPDADGAAVNAKVSAFVELLHGHEQRETSALMDAIWTDIGGQS